MEIQFDQSSVTLKLTPDEAERLGVALGAGYETVSRAEYYIRTGLSAPTVRQIADVLTSIDGRLEDRVMIDLAEGVEEVENPRRPRPS